MTRPLSVAIPWSLTHYIPLNGFHPLYRPLFEDRPEWITLRAWDNVELSERLTADPAFRSLILKEVSKSKSWIAGASVSETARQYYAHYWHVNHALTRLIPGDIELHHTAPFPSQSRPFVFHCESFDLFFFPFLDPAQLRESTELRRHYLELLENPLCLGISSHLGGTLDDISNYFQSDRIDGKLFQSGMGTSAGKIQDSPQAAQAEKGPVGEPVMLFLNSANQNPQNFFRRGGHLALRCWQALMQESHAGRLIMRCARPSDDALRDHGVDIAWLHRHLQSNILWIENFVSADEIASLMQLAHFMLLPSMALHSVSIMQAMHCGAIPVVSDTAGTDRYVIDGKTGIMLHGLRRALPKAEIAPRVQAVLNSDSSAYDSILLDQMVDRLRQLISAPERYAALRRSMVEHARHELNGTGFSQKFWSRVREAYVAFPGKPATGGATSAPATAIPPECFIHEKQWSRLFSSSPQPVSRLHAGRGRITELGGCFIASPGAQALGVHEWSPLAEFSVENAPHLYFGRTIKGIGGRYLGLRLVDSELSRHRRVIRWFSDRLTPYPTLFSLTSRSLKAGRRVLGIIPKTGQSVMATDWGDQFPEGDIELISQLDNGLNIIRCGYLYYAIAQTDGEFSKAKADAGKFSVCLTGASLKEIHFKIDEWQRTVSQNPSIELVEEGVSGYNLIRYNDRIYAIRQEEGAFSAARVFNNSYRNMYSGTSIESTKAAILGGQQ
jgi:glycosyltransferase involved in cell wall biosynthesis